MKQEPFDSTEWYDKNLIPFLAGSLEGPLKTFYGPSAKATVLPGCRVLLSTTQGGQLIESIIYCEFKTVDQKSQKVINRAGKSICSKAKEGK